MPDAPAPYLESVDDSADRELMTGEAVALDVRPTSYILLAAGAAIDWLVSAAVFLGLVFAILNLGGQTLDSALARALVTMSIVFAIVILPIAIEVLTRGRSLGRLAVGARIVRDDGGAAQLRHAFVRALMGVVEIYLTFGGLAALVGLLNTKSKRLGDMLAGTYSQYERVPPIVVHAQPVPLELVAWSSLADVARLPDRLSRRIAQFLAQAPSMTPASRYTLAGELAREAAPFVSPLPAAHPEVFLIAVSAIRRERDFTALMNERARLEQLAPVLEGFPHGFPDR